MKTTYPDHWLVSSATYWGRRLAAERRGERKSALVQYRACARGHRHRYYGQLALRALDRLARAGGSSAPKPPPLSQAGYREWLQPPAKSVRVREVAELLSSMGFHELAAKEYRSLGPSTYSRLPCGARLHGGGPEPPRHLPDQQILLGRGGARAEATCRGSSGKSSILSSSNAESPEGRTPIW